MHNKADADPCYLQSAPKAVPTGNQALLVSQLVEHWQCRWAEGQVRRDDQLVSAHSCHVFS